MFLVIGKALYYVITLWRILVGQNLLRCRAVFCFEATETLVLAYPISDFVLVPARCTPYVVTLYK